MLGVTSAHHVEAGVVPPSLPHSRSSAPLGRGRAAWWRAPKCSYAVRFDLSPLPRDYYYYYYFQGAYSSPVLVL